MRLILSNDDGVDAAGLSALAAAVRPFGEPFVVAPAGPQSGVGHQVTTGDAILVDRLAAACWSVAGTPADCARLAMTELVPDAAWLLAGINHGANLGADIYTSGTVAAVREAALLGYRGCAVSHYVGRGRSVDWALATQRLTPVLDDLLRRPLEAGHFWSVNLPHPDHDHETPIVFCGLDTRPHGVRYRRDGDRYRYDGDYHARPRQAGRDVEVCMSGSIAVTKVTLEIAAP